ncbi:Amidohydrolase [Paenibacillus sp. 1_12]|uniref:amidohydrolase family protein n=1 Tax=Paenibacillus sp. 1_12 TaxID=1566278 RepID=UPI0008E36924|nr:amidohydrolase family protein [Paenibacillus sp. 1_12]SFK79129.1 Amidohydrolase [Paenibacillus sp. 1_12]
MTWITDAYSHIGMPRYGGLADFVQHMQRFQIKKSVMVLAKTVPDFTSLFAGIADYPHTIRGVGIPFGQTEQQREEMVAIQLKAGVIGLRMEPAEIVANPAILRTLGEQGKWIFAISPFHSEAISRIYLDWLEEYPQSSIAAPHLLYSQSACEALKQSQQVRDLLRHPRFHVIFSRHGGTGSTESYPHSDFLPWMSYVFEQASIDRIMWGSEYPVIYSRNESMPQCISWLEAIRCGLSEQQLKDVMHDNTERCFFTEQGPKREYAAIPDWVAEQFDYQQTVRLYNHEGFELTLDVYGKLLNGYLQSDACREGIPFADYFMNQLTLLMKQN